MKNLLAKRVKKNNKGFTLVELIIVIAIIAILIAVLAPNYVRYVDRSRWSSDRNDCESLLQEVRTAIVDTQNDGGTVNSGEITVVFKRRLKTLILNILVLKLSIRMIRSYQESQQLQPIKLI